MQQLRLSCLLLFCFGLKFAFGLPPGVCVNQVITTKQRLVLDRTVGKWKNQVYTHQTEVQECCPGYKTETAPFRCTPVCDPECVKATCEAPNTCACLPGHNITNNSNTTCYETCDACVNGACVSEHPEPECLCFRGFQPDQTFKNACVPSCSQPCVNATCTAPDQCECYEKFVKDPNNKYVCNPNCSDPCVNGQCTSPDECSCFDGYTIIEESPNTCFPLCDPNCENGSCESPNYCKCSDGFKPHPRMPYRCVPQQPETHTLSFCELKLHKVLKYSKTSDCYIVKDNLLIDGDSQCHLLMAPLLPKCSQDNPCSINQCSLNFRCSAKAVNRSKEIHCDLDFDDFTTEDSTNTTITDDNDWLDVVLVLSSFQVINSSSKRSPTEEWTLHTKNKWAVCGRNHFALEVCDSSKEGSSSSKVFRIICALIVVILLISCFSAGTWFYWKWYRRINYPLNYRENACRGYVNEGCEDQPSELFNLNGSEEENMDL